jgi:hypothetical protein
VQFLSFKTIENYNMRISEGGFDQLVDHSLRIELLNGKVLIYNIDIKDKQYLINKLRANADGNEDNIPLKFLWFETSLNRSVIINSDSLASITFCFDAGVVNSNSNYVDNFEVVYSEDEHDEEIEEDADEKKENDIFLPQVIVYLKGQNPEDDYNKNPRTYDSLAPGALAAFNLELDGDCPFRQFINLTDDDGEEVFLPLEQIMVMEFDSALMDVEDDGYDEDDDAKNMDYRSLN